MENVNGITTTSAVLGAVLAQLRSEKGMTQGDLACKVGLSNSTWSRIEKGESGLSPDQLRAAALALGTTRGRILDLADAAEAEMESRGVQVEATNTPVAALAKALSVTGATAGAVSGARVAGALGAVAGSRVAGAAIGSVIPIVGPALGALVGAAIGKYLDDKLNK